METTLDRLDFLVLAVYLVSVVGLGSYFARGVKTSDDFSWLGEASAGFPWAFPLSSPFSAPTAI